MKTQQYNPSPLERSFAQAISGVQNQIQDQIPGTKITSVQSNLNVDNPEVLFQLEDADGDYHEIVIRVIQRIDNEQSET